MRHRWISSLVILALAACKNGGPTAPASVASGSLAGSWSATVTFADATCGPAETVSATVTQYGSNLGVYLTSKCYGSLNFYGARSEDHFSGLLTHKCGLADPYIKVPAVEAPWTATAEDHHILLESSAAANGTCAVAAITVDLKR